MVFGDHVQPAFEPVYRMCLQFVNELLVNIHHGVFGRIRRREVFERGSIYQVGITEIQCGQQLLIAV